MKSRQKTLMTNVGIYAFIAAVLAFNFYYWKTYVNQARGQINELKASLDNLEKEKAQKSSELEKANQTKLTFETETDRRRRELEDYGDFLKRLSDKPDAIENLQKLIEETGIRIRKVTFNPLSRGEGANYWTFNFQMELEGPYKAFKFLLLKLPRQQQIFRIQNFEVVAFDNPRHDWEVRLQLETYFSGQG